MSDAPWMLKQKEALKARNATMYKGPAPGEGGRVLGGSVAICLTGIMLGQLWFSHIADRKPRTMTPQWEAATAKYRAAQNQDPISNM